MSARQKLNVAVFTGAILVGGLVAAATGSTGWGLCAGIALMIGGLYDGTFRSSSTGAPRHRRSRHR